MRKVNTKSKITRTVERVISRKIIPTGVLPISFGNFMLLISCKSMTGFRAIG